MGNFRLYTLSSLEYVSFEERRGYLFFIFWDGDVLNDIWIISDFFFFLLNSKSEREVIQEKFDLYEIV